MGSKRFLLNTALLTGAALLMRCIGMAFQAWLAGRIGAAGIGLFQLVMSVEGLCATFAISGIRFAATRLVAEELGHGRAGGVGAAMRRCLGYSLFFGLSAGAVLFFCAEPAAFLWIGDGRCARSLRTLAFGLPFISLSSVFSGYFTANSRVLPPSLVHLAEQLVCVTLVALFLSRAKSGDIEASCAAVTLGVTCSDMLSFLMMLAAYAADRRRHGGTGEAPPKLTGRMLRVALPLAFSAYARSALSTLQHLLVPRGLRRSGLSADASLSGYGVIQGMAMPVIGFPACLLLALAELIVPKLTEAQVQGDTAGIARSVRTLLRRTALFSLLTSGALFLLSDKLGLLIYGSLEAGRYIRLLAPLAPIMYADTVVDGCLKGLGQQVWSMGINILDAAIGVTLVWFLLPRFGLPAYVGIIYLNECVNLLLSCARLKKAAGL